MSPSAPSQNGTDVVLAELAEEFTNRVQAGEPVDVESYVQRYPEQAERLRRLLPALALLDDLGRSVSASPDGAVMESREGSLAGVLGDSASSARSAREAWALSTRRSKSRCAAGWR